MSMNTNRFSWFSCSSCSTWSMNIWFPILFNHKLIYIYLNKSKKKTCGGEVRITRSTCGISKPRAETSVVINTRVWPWRKFLEKSTKIKKNVSFLVFVLLVKLVLVFFVKDFHEEHLMRSNSFHLILLKNHIHVLFDKIQSLDFDLYLANSFPRVLKLFVVFLKDYSI
jgi:hypothetical protein